MAIYLDNNATTALNAQVLDAMLPYMGSVCGNPSSVHRFGRLQRDAIERAREQVASLVEQRLSRLFLPVVVPSRTSAVVWTIAWIIGR